MRKIILYPILILLAFTGCFLDPGSSSSPPKVVSTIYPKFDTPVSTSSPAYLVLTNYDGNNRYVPRVTINGLERSIESRGIPKTISEDNDINYLPRIRRDIHFNIDPNNLRASGSRSGSRTVVEDMYSDKVVGNTHNFYVVDKDLKTSKTLFKLVSKESITGGPLLYIWVDNSQTGSTPAGSISHLKSKFNGIYTKMTALYGSHWGSHNGPDILAENNKDIHILLTDIQNDQNVSDNGYMTGYFYAYDTFNEADSNKCLNLVIDSFDYFDLDDGNTWSPENYSVTVGISTIIHEFQHMIHWYQKSITQNTINDTFVNEMFSMIAEDLFAQEFLEYKLGGVTTYLTPDLQRVPFFNQFWDDNSSFHWDNNGNVGSLTNYSMSYIMGAYLIRNYGTQIIADYFEAKKIEADGSSYPLKGKDGLLYALNKLEQNTHTTETLLQNFGIAVLSSMSNTQEKPYSFRAIDTTLSSFNLKQLNLFDKYESPIPASFNNRLYDFNINELKVAYTYGKDVYYEIPFNPISLSQLNDINSTRNFLSESNIYVYLGELNSSDEIKIEMYDHTISAKVVVTP